MSSLPPPSTIPISAFNYALSLYPSLVENVYKSKLKDPKKVSDALKRDKWRFEDLPASLAQTKGVDPTSQPNTTHDLKEGGLTKDAVERLVQWKITHGHSRPFLPAMVRKNEASAVQTQTSLAFGKLASSATPSTSTITAALDLVCKLTGIGPATGTLILTIYDPVHIPFFQDEMFVWFFPEADGVKLKYNAKEYQRLLEAVPPVLKKLDARASDLEKVSYVLGHMGKLEESTREELEKVLNATVEKETDPADTKRLSTNASSAPAEATTDLKRGRKRPSKLEADESGESRPKRRSQRSK